jgi:hypothetical protein
MVNFQNVRLSYWQPSSRSLVSLINCIWLSGEVRYKARPLAPRKYDYPLAGPSEGRPSNVLDLS